MPGLYRIEVPLPGSALRATNCYVVKGEERDLIIDTGWNRADCMAALVSGLKECSVDLERADFFVTHMHADHLGLVPALARNGAKVYCGKVEPGFFQSTFSQYWAKRSDFARRHGFCEQELRKVATSHPGHRYGANTLLDLCVLREGEVISVGDYLFQCIETPGHTQEHVCLYESKRKILVSGDHLLVDITPNISLWSEEWDALKEYLNSLDKVENLEVEIVLPGHRRVFNNHRERIEELKQHHERRLGEIVGILRRGKQTAFQIARQMTWDVEYGCWDSFPPSQKWFAFGEALAHLRYLEEMNKVGMEETREQRVVFFLEDYHV